MSGLADTFPYSGLVNAPSYPVVVSATAPANPTIGNAWLDTSQVPPVLYVYDGATWVVASSSSTGLPPATAADQTLVSTAAGQNWKPSTLDQGRY